MLWELVRRVSPTRAHPVVARRPPGNVVAALPLFVLDRGRDLVDRALLNAPGPVTPALHRISSALERTSNAVELLPIMRSGEDPSTRTIAGRPPFPWGTVVVCAAGAGFATYKIRRATKQAG